jgi:hypothetical protein
MAGIEDLLGGALSGDTIAKIAAQLGTTPEGAQKGIGAALPQLLGKLKATAEHPENGAHLAESLRNNNGADLDDLDGVMSRSGTQGTEMVGQLLGSDADAVHGQIAADSGLDKSQSAGLLGMLAPLVLGAAGRASGDGVAPSPQGLSGMLGGLMGGGAGGAGGLGGLLGGLLGGGGAGGAAGMLGGLLGGNGAGASGGAAGAVGNMLGGAGQQAGAAGGALGGLTGMLDQNKDGSIVDDVARMASGGGQRGGIVGKLLGMLGRK